MRRAAASSGQGRHAMPLRLPANLWLQLFSAGTALLATPCCHVCLYHCMRCRRPPFLECTIYQPHGLLFLSLAPPR